MSKKQEGTGIDRKLHDPVSDKLSPVFPLDLGKVAAQSAKRILVRLMERRNLSVELMKLLLQSRKMGAPIRLRGR